MKFVKAATAMRVSQNTQSSTKAKTKNKPRRISCVCCVFLRWRLCCVGCVCEWQDTMLFGPATQSYSKQLMDKALSERSAKDT
jgi:hypothetical protein